MTAIFTTVGSAADYGTFGRWLLFVITCICWAAQFASMSLTSMLIMLLHKFDYADSFNATVPSRWPVAMALYMIGFISYGATLVFYAAVFPRLARNTPHARRLRNRYQAGEIEQEEYELEESMEKNRISNISTASNIQHYMWYLTRSDELFIDSQQYRLHSDPLFKFINFATTGLKSQG